MVTFVLGLIVGVAATWWTNRCLAEGANPVLKLKDHIVAFICNSVKFFKSIKQETSEEIKKDGQKQEDQK